MAPALSVATLSGAYSNAEAEVVVVDNLLSAEANLPTHERLTFIHSSVNDLYPTLGVTSAQCFASTYRQPELLAD